jgi:hypothetical protein
MILRSMVKGMLAACVVATPLLAQGEDLVAEGSGLGANREEALIAAKRDAVEKGIGMVLLSQTEIENFMVKRDQVITKTIGAVKSFEVLSEGTTPDNLYQMRIKAVISRAAMREDLAAFHILIESMDKPRIMVLVAENNVDPQVTAAIRASKIRMAEVAGDPAAAAAIGAQNGAEVIITGNAVGREAKGMAESLGGMVSVQADVTLKAINCTSARVIGTGSGHGAKVHISPNTAGTQAIGKAAETAMKGLLDKIITEWQNQLNNGITIQVSVSNVSTFRQKAAIVKTFQGLSNIVAVRERTWNGASKTLELDVQYKGNVNGFCTRVDGFKMKAGGGSLSVTGVSGMSVTLNAEVM